jgi:CMP-N-acetylneuraminic acid synthetase
LNNASPNVIALLPMKGHSERVPNKNMRSFCGQPLFHRIAAALERSPFVESIVIDTDSAIIARDAALHFKKARIVERPNELCGDAVPMNAIIAHDISLCRGEHFIQTHSTNPLLRSDTLNACIEAYFSALSRTDSLFSVTRIQSRLYWESGAAINHDPRELLRTQDLPPVFAENSNVYVFSRTSFVAAGNRRIGLKPSMFPLNRLEAIDIDDEEDFLLAEAMQALAQGNRQEPHDKPEK